MHYTGVSRSSRVQQNNSNNVAYYTKQTWFNNAAAMVRMNKLIDRYLAEARQEMAVPYTIVDDTILTERTVQVRRVYCIQIFPPRNIIY